jgi:flagellar biosynthesis/type III secretory pathway M-ring protein FliF/YscJ
MFTQLDDDDQGFMVAYASQFNNKLKTKYNSYEKNALWLFGLSHHLFVIFMVAHSLWL